MMSIDFVIMNSEGNDLYIFGDGYRLEMFLLSFKQIFYTYKNVYVITNSESMCLKKCILINEEQWSKMVCDNDLTISLQSIGNEGKNIVSLDEYIHYIKRNSVIQDYEQPLINQIDVKLNYSCNFRCEYCYQVDENGNRSSDYLSLENAKGLVKLASKLGYNAHFYMAGGEPFIYPHLEFLVKELTLQGHYLNFITNFSMPFEKIKRIISMANDKIDYFSISIHISQWNDINELYEKIQSLLELKETMKLSMHIVTTCVLTEENYNKLLEIDYTMSKRFPEIYLNIQRVYYHNKYKIYSNKIEQFLCKRGLDVPVEDVDKIDYFGRKCWAGSRFIYIEANGEIRRCYTNQYNKKTFIFGNLSDVDSVKLFSEPMPCLSCDNNCICYRNFETLKHITDVDAYSDEIYEFAMFGL